jgi:hypothetical protein
MVFSQYRESVYEITEMLATHEQIKPMEFVGQSSTGTGARKSVTQKAQLDVVKKFRDGGYNVLISTCVGEEGLDIGEVDLIVNYDSQNSPIRLIQRMGRTGRKREGRIIILLTEGKEENSYKTSLTKKKNIYKIIVNGQKHFQFYKDNPLMIPKSIKPKCQQMRIEVPTDSLGDQPKKKPVEKPKKATPPPKKTKEKSTQATKKGAKKSEEDDDSLSLPDLDLDFNMNPEASVDMAPPPPPPPPPLRQPPTTTPPLPKISPAKKQKETQLKLFSDCNFLNLNKKPVPSASIFSNLVNQVPEPPKNIKKLLKFFSIKGTVESNTDYLVTLDEVVECVRSWEMDEDDFLHVDKNDSFKQHASLTMSPNRSTLNESFALKERFSSLFQDLIDGISDEESNDDAMNACIENQSSSDNMIVNETMFGDSNYNLSGSSGKAVASEPFKKSTSPLKLKETAQVLQDFKPKQIDTNYLNALFSSDESDDDDDLKYLDKIPELQTSNPEKSSASNQSKNNEKMSFLIDDTICNSKLDKTDDVKSQTSTDPTACDQVSSAILTRPYPTSRIVDNLIKGDKHADSVVDKNSNSTSTPVRSILKTNSNILSTGVNKTTAESAKISYSPLLSPMDHNNSGDQQVTPKSNKSVSFNPESAASLLNTGGSMVGITQALKIINNSTNATPVTTKKSSPNASGKHYRITFDMKSSLHDLFDNDESNTSASHENETMSVYHGMPVQDDNFFEMTTSFQSKKTARAEQSINLINDDSDIVYTESKNDKRNSRRLRFDEPSILETSNYGKSKTKVSTVEDNVILLNEIDNDRDEDLSAIKCASKKVK